MLRKTPEIAQNLIISHKLGLFLTIFNKASKNQWNYLLWNSIYGAKTRFSVKTFEVKVFRNCLNCLKQFFFSEKRTKKIYPIFCFHNLSDTANKHIILIDKFSSNNQKLFIISISKYKWLIPIGNCLRFWLAYSSYCLISSSSPIWDNCETDNSKTVLLFAKSSENAWFYRYLPSKLRNWTKFQTFSNFN
jgi:hypothetical protein